MSNTKPKLHIVSLSGGKDSTAMFLRMLEEGMPVDIVLFCDTGLEFPAMYDHLNALERYTGKEITRIRAEHTFEYYFMEHDIKRKTSSGIPQNQKGYSWAGPKSRWCTEHLKNQPRKRYFRSLHEQYHIIEYVGIAADEGYRLNRKNNQRDNCLHPLVDWGMTEADCLQYCYERGFHWNGLYEIFSRVSCWCCPLQSLEELRKLYRHFPDLWDKLKYWDSKTWRKFRADYSVRELEIRFDLEEEWRKAGHPPKGKAFFTALKTRLKQENNTEG